MSALKHTHSERISARIITCLVFIIAWMSVNGQQQKEEDVKLVRVEDKNEVDIIIGGKFFTSYQYPVNIEKPFLFPVIAPNGSVITRGFPIEPRKGERVDHPHHTGLWFNYGDVNGIDFWNNSSDIPVSKKDLYGHPD